MLKMKVQAQRSEELRCGVVVDVFCCVNAQNITVTDSEVKLVYRLGRLVFIHFNGNLLKHWEQFINLCLALLC